MRDQTSHPSYESEPSYEFDGGESKFANPLNERPPSRDRGSLRERTAYLFEDDKEDGVTDQEAWEDEVLGQPEHNGSNGGSTKEAETESNGHKADEEQDETGSKTLLRIIKAENKVAERWPNWQTDKNCRDHSIERFFPGRGGPSDETKQICMDCKVGHACLMVALEAQYDNGVWGGFAEAPRKKLRRLLKSGGTWEDVLEIREKAKEDLSMTQDTQVTLWAKEKIKEIKARDK